MILDLELQLGFSERKTIELEDKSAVRRFREIRISGADHRARVFASSFKGACRVESRSHNSSKAVDRFSFAMKKPAGNLDARRKAHYLGRSADRNWKM